MWKKALNDSWSHFKFSFFRRRKQKAICEGNLVIYQMSCRVFFQSTLQMGKVFLSPKYLHVYLILYSGLQFSDYFHKDNTNPSIIRQKQDRYFFKKGSKGTLLIWLLQLFYKYVGKLFSLFFIINKSRHLYKFKFK